MYKYLLPNNYSHKRMRKYLGIYHVKLTNIIIKEKQRLAMVVAMCGWLKHN